MDISRHSRMKWAFVLTKDELSKFDSAFKDSSGTVEYEIECSDNLNRVFTEVDKLQEYENPPNKQIKAIEFTARSKDKDWMANIEFSSSPYENILIRLKGPEEYATKLNTTVEELLIGMKPWYARLATTDYMVIFFVLLVGLYFGFFIAGAIGLIGESVFRVWGKTVPFKTGAIIFLIVMLTITSPLVLGYPLNRFRDYLFPLSVFAIGQGAKRHAHKEWIRKGVVIVSFLSVVTGLFVAWVIG